MVKFSLSLLLIAALGACTWVEVDTQAEDVVVAKPVHVQNCEKLSTTDVSVADSVGFIPRSSEKIGKELQALAKNETHRKGGDTIVPQGRPEEGRQAFGVYRCE